MAFVECLAESQLPHERDMRVCEALLVPQGTLRVVAHGGDGESLFFRRAFGLMILGLYVRCVSRVMC